MLSIYSVTPCESPGLIRTEVVGSQFVIGLAQQEQQSKQGIRQELISFLCRLHSGLWDVILVIKNESIFLATI